MSRAGIGNHAQAWAGEASTGGRRPGRIPIGGAAWNRLLSLGSLVLLWWIGARVAGSP
jgi:hypothetical protein